MDKADVERVFEAWRKRQKQPARCRLTESRRTTIARRLKEHTADELVTLTNFAYDADEPGPRHWRGGNREGRVYLGLDNLLRIGKLADRVEDALEWADTDDGRDDDVPASNRSEAANPGPMARFMNKPRRKLGSKKLVTKVRGRTPRRD